MNQFKIQIGLDLEDNQKLRDYDENKKGENFRKDYVRFIFLGFFYYCNS